MPTCTQCGESAAFHELTNYEIPATPDETTERLCFQCVRKELELYEAKAEADAKSLIQFADERKSAVAELERVQKQFGTCSICGYIAWKDKDARTEECEFCKMRKELERVKAQCAEMRKALDLADDLAPVGSGAEAIIRNALSTDAGRDYIHRDKVKPLVEALKWMSARRGCIIFAELPEHVDEFFQKADEALAGAKELGL